MSRRRSLNTDLRFLIDLARALGGALVFALPMLMTMEMWWLGFYMDPLRFALLLLVTIPLLIGLSHFIGFEDTFGWKDDVLDAFVALGIGFLAAAPVLLLFGVIGPGMSFTEIIGKIALQAVPASIGALLAQSQFGGSEGRGARQWRTYGGETFFMAAGAVYLCLNVAATEEMILIAHMMTPWHGVGLMAMSILLMHAFVYSLQFRGGHRGPEGVSWWNLFLRFTVVGYALCLLISAYMLWTFGRVDGVDNAQIVMATVVLAFPAAIGAAAARLIL